MDMKFLPSPPTDNLYKFLAIFGSWVLFAVLIFLMFVNYVNYRNGEILNQIIENQSAKARIEKSKRRLVDIATDHLDRDVFKGVIHDGSPREIFLLHAFIKGNSKYLKNHPKRGDKLLSGFWDVFDAMHGEWVVLGLMCMGVISFLYGFIEWRNRVQKISDRILQAEMTLKERQVAVLHQKVDGGN